MPHFALFLPFSRNERRQVGASASKQNRLEVIEKTRKIGAYGESATACKPRQNRPSQASGPGSHRFKSCRPDHFVFNSLHVKPFRKSGRYQEKSWPVVASDQHKHAPLSIPCQEKPSDSSNHLDRACFDCQALTELALRPTAATVPIHLVNTRRSLPGRVLNRSSNSLRSSYFEKTPRRQQS